MTQDDLAAHCGLFRTYMSRIETGQANPTLTMVHALATSLEVDVTDLFTAVPSARATDPVAPTQAASGQGQGALISPCRCGTTKPPSARMNASAEMSPMLYSTAPARAFGV